MRYISIAGLGWLPLVVLALWWAGFAPFPQHPVYADTVCTQHPQTRQEIDIYGNQQSCLPGGHVTEQKPERNSVDYGPGWAQCPPPVPGAFDTKTAEPINIQCFSWKQVRWGEVPAFGLFGTTWVAFTYTPDNAQKPNGNFMDAHPVAAYHSYAACWFAHRNGAAVCDRVTTQSAGLKGPAG